MVVLHIEIGAYLGWFYTSFTRAGFSVDPFPELPQLKATLLLPSSLVCLLPLLMKVIRNLLSFPAYQMWFLEEFLFASPSTGGFYRARKQRRGSWRDKTYMGNWKWSSCCSNECILIGLHLVLFTWISVPASLLTGEYHGVLVCFGVLEIPLHPSDLDHWTKLNQICHWTQNLGVCRCAGRKEENLTN